MNKFVLFFTLLCLPAVTKGQDRFDDVLQYVSYTSVFALKAVGVPSRNNWPKLAATAAASWVGTAGVAYVLKHSVKEWRPDQSDQLSFPSGHSAFAFAGATVLRKEFGHVTPWIPVVGYSIAVATAIDRVAKDRHYWYDTVAGAGIGILSTEISYFLSDMVFGKNNHLTLTFTGTRFDLAWYW